MHIPPLLDLALPPTQRGHSTFKGKKGQAFAPVLGHTHSHTDVLTVTHDLSGVSGQACMPSTHTGREGGVGTFQPGEDLALLSGIITPAQQALLHHPAIGKLLIEPQFPHHYIGNNQTNHLCQRL